MNIEDLKKLKSEDLVKLLTEKRDELRMLRFKASANQLSQVHKIKDVKKTISRILTLMNQ